MCTFSHFLSLHARRPLLSLHPVTYSTTLLRYPTVYTIGASVGRTLRATDRVSWRFVDVPAGLVTTPALFNPATLHASFTPTTPGSYILEMAAFDGCHLTYDVLNVTFGCEACHVQTLRTLPESEVQYDGNARTFGDGLFIVPVPQAAIANVVFTLLRDAEPLHNDSSNPLELRVRGAGRAPLPLGDRSVTLQQQLVQFELVEVLQSFEDLGTSNATSVLRDDGEFTTYDKHSLELVQSQLPPRREFAFFSSDSFYTVSETSTYVTQNHTYREEEVVKLCDVELQFTVYNKSWAAAVVSASALFGDPQLCQSRLSLMTSFIAECGVAPQPDVLNVTLACGLAPVAVLDCAQTNIAFDNITLTFPSTTLYGRQSYGWSVESYANLRYSWNVCVCCSCVCVCLSLSVSVFVCKRILCVPHCLFGGGCAARSHGHRKTAPPSCCPPPRTCSSFPP